MVPGVEQRINGGFLAFHRSWSADAIIITVEDNRVSITPQQDQGIGALLEPVADPGFQRFMGLRIMIVNKSYGIAGMGLDERIVKDLGQIKVPALQCSRIQLVVKRYIEQVDLIIYRVEEFPAGFEIRVPEFADNVEVLTAFLPISAANSLMNS